MSGRSRQFIRNNLQMHFSRWSDHRQPGPQTDALLTELSLQIVNVLNPFVIHLDDDVFRLQASSLCRAVLSIEAT